MKKVISLFCSACWVIASPTSGAADEIDVPCHEGEKYSPDGRVEQIGDRWFRVCDGGFLDYKVGRWKALFVASEKHLNALLPNILPGFRYRSTLYFNPKWTKNARKAGPDSMTVSINGTIYTVDPPSSFDDLKLDPDGPYPSWSDFNAEATADTPQHDFACSSPLPKPFPKNTSCFLRVRYKKGEDLYIRQQFHFFEGRRHPGFGNAEFKLENLADHARNLRRIYQALEVPKPEAD